MQDLSVDQKAKMIRRLPQIKKDVSRKGAKDATVKNNMKEDYDRMRLRRQLIASLLAVFRLNVKN